MVEANRQEVDGTAAQELDTEAVLTVQEIMDHLYKTGDYAAEITVRGVLKEVLDNRNASTGANNDSENTI